MSEGRKDDNGKLRWGLLRKSCVNALEGVIRVLMYGAKKYGDDNWKDVDNAERRYRDALDRHLADLDRGVEFDPDTGEDNWAHVATNAIFVLQLREEARRQAAADSTTLGTVLPPLACERPTAIDRFAEVTIRTRRGQEMTGRVQDFTWGPIIEHPEYEIVNWKRV